MKVLLAPKLKVGDHIRVVAPATSLAHLSPERRQLAVPSFKNLGIRLSYSQHAEESDEFHSSSIASRVEDLHQAFLDPSVNGIISAFGGFNSNQLLKHLDYKLIKSHPKILCGYSDITALQNAIFAQTGLITYSGPDLSSFARAQAFEFTNSYFKKCLFNDLPFEVSPSTSWSDAPWDANCGPSDLDHNPGYELINEGTAEGIILGGNLCTLNLLQGTPFMPPLTGSILFLEEDETLGSQTDIELDRNLQSLIHLPEFSGVRGLVFGRFQKASQMTKAKLKKITASKPELKSLPIIYDLDFGHTDPCFTFPIGGTCSIEAKVENIKLSIIKH